MVHSLSPSRLLPSSPPPLFLSFLSPLLSYSQYSQCDFSQSSRGFNGDGQLGLGVEEDADYPTEVKALTDYRILRVQCGLDFTAFLTTEGQLFVTGNNQMGQLGLGHKDNLTIPHIVSDALRGRRVVDVACGGTHMLVLCDSGEVYGWGSGGDGRLGLIHTDDCLIPTRLAALSDKGVTRLFAGGGHSFAVNDTDRKLWAWGFGLCGRLGVGHGENVYEPTLIDFDWQDRVIVSISAGVDHNLMVTQKTA
jgi:alpha-tubulin suppressor-like RCC1 family protein